MNEIRIKVSGNRWQLIKAALIALLPWRNLAVIIEAAVILLIAMPVSAQLPTQNISRADLKKTEAHRNALVDELAKEAGDAQQAEAVAKSEVGKIALRLDAAQKNVTDAGVTIANLQGQLAAAKATIRAQALRLDIYNGIIAACAAAAAFLAWVRSGIAEHLPSAPVWMGIQIPLGAVSLIAVPALVFLLTWNLLANGPHLPHVHFSILKLLHFL